MGYKIILAALLFICSCIGLQAQGQMEDIVHLKDGKIIKGEVLEYNPKENLKIKVLGESILVYKSSEVVKIEKEEKQTTATNEKESPKSHQPSDVGLYHAVGGETAFQLGNGTWGSSISFTSSTGWSFHRLFGIGAGLGIKWGRHALLPIYANIRGNFMKSSASLFYDINVGYGIPLPEAFRGGIVRVKTAEGGLYLRPSIGIRFSSKKRTHVFLDVGCTIQFTRYEYIDWNDNLIIGSTIPYKPSIRVGVVF